MDKAKVLLADDHRLVREGIKMVIDQLPGLVVVGECENGTQLYAAARSIHPELVVLDISMPQSKCAETIRFIRRECPEAKVLVLSMHTELAYLNMCLEAGASGYIRKAASHADLIQAINTVLNGGVYIDPQLARRMATHMQRSQSSAVQAVKQLSDRESEVLRMVARGHTNKEIAELMSISDKSVETYKNRALEKLELKGRTSLLRYALAHGWLEAL